MAIFRQERRLIASKFPPLCVLALAAIVRNISLSGRSVVSFYNGRAPADEAGGRLVKHAQYGWPLLAEGHLNRNLFGEILSRRAALLAPGG